MEQETLQRPAQKHVRMFLEMSWGVQTMSASDPRCADCLGPVLILCEGKRLEVILVLMCGFSLIHASGCHLSFVLGCQLPGGVSDTWTLSCAAPETPVCAW